MDELLVKLKTKYPVLTLSMVHLGRLVRDINITLKQTRLRYVPTTIYKKPIVIKNQIKEFYNMVKQYRLDDIICICGKEITANNKARHEKSIFHCNYIKNN